MKDLSPIEQARLDDIVVKDKLCEICFTKQELLCSGIRPYIDEKATKYYGLQMIYTGVCSKKQALVRKATIDDRIAKSGLATYWKHVQPTFVPTPVVINDKTIAIGEELRIPTRAYLDYRVGMSAYVFKLGIHTLLSGYSVKFLPIHEVSSIYKSNLTKMVVDLGESCDLLIVWNLSGRGLADYMYEAFLNALDLRIASCRPTLVVLGDNVTVREGAKEEALIKQIRTWQEIIPLLLQL